MSRVAVVFPGRGSYTAASLGSLDPAHPLVAEVEALRADYGLVSLAELDGAAQFDPRTHLLPANAGPLTYLVSLVDAAALPEDAEPVVAVGSAPGWYAALAATGALSVADGFRLVQEMGLLEEEPPAEGGAGGQVIYPLVATDWRPDPTRARAVDEALASADGSAYRSLDLGGYLVLAGTEDGVAHLMAALPAARIGDRRYPLRLALHGPYHTPLVAHVAERARERLASLTWKTPEIALVDGRGVRWSPWSTDPVALRDYTLGEQVTAPFDLATSLRVALREWAPDALALPGPGTSLRAIGGQALVREGYRGVRSRAEFEEHQRREPLILPVRR